jgi:hypothetical protein
LLFKTSTINEFKYLVLYNARTSQKACSQRHKPHLTEIQAPLLPGSWRPRQTLRNKQAIDQRMDLIHYTSPLTINSIQEALAGGGKRPARATEGLVLYGRDCARLDPINFICGLHITISESRHGPGPTLPKSLRFSPSNWALEVYE